MRQLLGIAGAMGKRNCSRKRTSGGRTDTGWEGQGKKKNGSCCCVLLGLSWLSTWLGSFGSLAFLCAVRLCLLPWTPLGLILILVLRGSWLVVRGRTLLSGGGCNSFALAFLLCCALAYRTCVPASLPIIRTVYTTIPSAYLVPFQLCWIVPSGHDPVLSYPYYWQARQGCALPL